MKKYIVIGVIITCFLMLMIPNISALQYQTAKKNIKTNIEEKFDNKILSFKSKINKIKNNELNIKGLELDLDLIIMRIIVLFILLALWVNPSLWTGLFESTGSIIKSLWFLIYLATPIFILDDIDDLLSFIPNVAGLVWWSAIPYTIIWFLLSSFTEFTTKLNFIPGQAVWMGFHILLIIYWILYLIFVGPPIENNLQITEDTFPSIS